MNGAASDKRTKKWVWGCTGGCLGFLLIIALAIFLGFRWLAAPVPVVPAETFLTPKTSVMLFVKIRRDDPMMLDVPVKLARTPAFKEWLRRLASEDAEDLEVSSEGAREMVQLAAPLQFVFTLQRSEEKEVFEAAAAFSHYRWSRLYGMVARSLLQRAPEERRQTYKEAELAVEEDGSVLALRRNNLMVASSRGIIETWVDRLAQQRRSAAAAEAGRAMPELPGNGALKAAYERLQMARPVRFISLNAHGELAALLSLLPDGEGPESVADSDLVGDRVISLAAQLGRESEEDAELVAFLECTDAETASELREALQALVGQVGESAPIQDVTTAVEDAVIRIEAVVPAFPRKAASALQYLAQRVKEERKQQAPQQ